MTKRTKETTMSLNINVRDVVAVLVGNEWVELTPGTFDLDAYEFHDGGRLVHEGGQREICSTGFTGLTEDQGEEVRVAGPLTAIQAVMYRSKPKPSR